MSDTPAPSLQPVSPGLIIFESDYGSIRAVWQMDGDGANKHAVVVDEGIDGWPEWPRWFPDGQRFAYRWTYAQDNGKHLQSIWIANRGGTEHLQVSDPAECAWYWWRGEKTLGFSTGTGSTCDPYDPHQGDRTQHYFYDLATGETRKPELPPDIVEYRAYLYSPDGEKVASMKEGQREFRILHLLSREEVTVFTIPEQDPRGEIASCAWSLDSNHLAFTYCFDGPGEIPEVFCDLYTVQADGRNLHRLTDLSGEYSGGGSIVRLGRLSWAPDGQWLAFTESLSGEGLSYIGVIPATGGQITHLRIAWSGGQNPVWSPDSTKLAFLSNVNFMEGHFADPYMNLGQWDIFTVDIQTRQIQRLTNDPAMEMHIDWK
jgi:Tol biopolymer transport system component